MTVVTFWRVQPLVPTVNTGESVTVTVEACYDERQTIVAGPGIDLASLPNPRCGASIREGTWSVVGAGSGNDVLGHVTAGTPSSSAVYMAPHRLPQDRVVLEVSLYWRERGLTKKMRIPVMVTSMDHADDHVPGVIFPPQFWTEPYDPTSSAPLTGMAHVDLDDGEALDFSWTINPS